MKRNTDRKIGSVRSLASIALALFLVGCAGRSGPRLAPLEGASNGPAKCPSNNRLFYFVNLCQETVWIGATGGAGPACNNGSCPAGQSCNTNTSLCYWTLPEPVDNSGSFELAADSSATVCLPSPPSGDTQWNGILFGRTGCAAGGTCQTGDCGGGTGPCPVGTGPTGPTTIAEPNLGFAGTADNYDISMVNGVNLGMEIAPLPRQKWDSSDPYNCGATGSPDAPSPYTCTWSFSPQTITVPATKPPKTYDQSLMQNVIPFACSSSTSCPNGLTCSDPEGGYCPCTAASDCVASSPSGLACGLALTGPTVTQMCGTSLGWWTPDEVCGEDASFGFPFNCTTSVTNPTTGNATTYANLYLCQAPNAGDCYGPATADCCGCPNDAVWPPLITGEKCFSSNPNWIEIAQPWLVLFKTACPSAYAFANDDATVSFGCAKATTGYQVTFCPVGASPARSLAKSTLQAR